MMTIALWDEAALDFFSRAASELSGQLPIDVIRASRRECRDAVIDGSAQIALIPILQAFREVELFDVLPAVSLSSWDNPYVRLLVKEALGSSIKTVAIDPAFPQEALLAKVILKEHYNSEPVFQPAMQLSSKSVAERQEDAVLLIQNTTELKNHPGMQLDLGRDWFELTHYPMVWGVFVMGKGQANDEAVKTLRTLAQYTELYSGDWVAENTISEPLKSFYTEGLRYRLDDLAVAGITALQDYLYYNEALEDMSPLPMYELVQDQDDDEEGPLL